MNRLAVALGSLVVIGFAVFMAVTSTAAWDVIHPSRDVADGGAPDLNNGKIMFIVADCAICHASPNQHDDTRLGGGDSLGSSFGTFYMPNISADMHDGIGGWTTAQFVRAMREGVSPGGASAEEEREGDHLHRSAQDGDV